MTVKRSIPKGNLRAPFPYFGAKGPVAKFVWERFGQVKNFCEPFFGSGAVLLQRPQPFDGPETVNDANAFLSNFWRSVKHDPHAVADYADAPVNETDLSAVHYWLVNTAQDQLERMKTDPDYYDAKAAGRWVHGLSCWIGSGWCMGKPGDKASIKIPGLGAKDIKGVHTVRNQLPHLGGASGINRGSIKNDIYSYFEALSERFRYVRVACGDWSRVCTKAPTWGNGLTAVFL